MNQVHGRHPVHEALKAGRVSELFVARGTDPGYLANLRQLAQKSGVPVKMVPREKINSLAQGGNHQGVAAVVSDHQAIPLHDLLETHSSEQQPFYLVAVGVEDPQNMGSLIRVAESAGLSGVIIPERRSAGLTPAVARASAGALEWARVARVKNAVRAIEQMKERGIWVYGADPEAKMDHWTPDLTVPLALVMGGEHKGIPRLVKKHCDELIKIPLLGRTPSLNVSTAAAIIIYEALRQRMACLDASDCV